MPNRSIVFLSHIHEEKEMALLLKNTIEDEFSGFVEVFVSSDGDSIPAGVNFLKRIEYGLLKCSAALYLISLRSIKRSWISFELGAVWIRSLQSVCGDNAEIPSIPLCHTGMTPEKLPPPLSNIDAVLATSSAGLTRVFRSIQTAVGARGRLKTDFDNLALAIQEHEREYIRYSYLFDLLSVFGKHNFKHVVSQCESLPKGAMAEFKKSGIDTLMLGYLRALEEWFRLYTTDQVELKISDLHDAVDPSGETHIFDICLKVPAELVLTFKERLLSDAQSQSIWTIYHA